jgi:hypothetical protein
LVLSSHTKSTATLAGILSHTSVKQAQPAAATTMSVPPSAKIKKAETTADTSRAELLSGFLPAMN